MDDDNDTAPESSQQYNVTHRALLQAIMARSTITFAEARPVLAAILSAHGELILWVCWG